jgi:hypothetical protein
MRPFLVATAVLVASAAFAAPVSGCSVDGYESLREAATTSVAIIEADVLKAYPDGGYEVRVRTSLKGHAGVGTIDIGRSPAEPSGGDCGGPITLVPSERVILALGRADNILAFETAVWWIESNGSIRRTNLVPNETATTRDDVVRALRLSVPETDTLSSADAPPQEPANSSLPWIAGAVAMFVLVGQFGRRQIGRSYGASGGRRRSGATAGTSGPVVLPVAELVTGPMAMNPAAEFDTKQIGSVQTSP